MRQTVISFAGLRCATLVVVMIVFLVTVLYLNNQYDAIVPTKVNNANSLVGLILGGFVSKVVLGISPIEALFYSNEKIAKAVAGKWLIASHRPGKD